GGTGNDSVVFDSGSSLTGTLDGGDGTDSIQTDDNAHVFTMTGPNAGTISDHLSGGFQNVEALSGGVATTDKIVGASGDHTWTLGSTNQYDTTASGVQFSGIEDVQGAGGVDAFNITGASDVQSADGGLGDD